MQKWLMCGEFRKYLKKSNKALSRDFVFGGSN
jgi:hypothetical protein